MKNDFIPGTEGQTIIWMDNFIAQLPEFQAQFGIDEQDITNIQNKIIKWEQFLKDVAKLKTDLQSVVEGKNVGYVDLETDVRTMAAGVKKHKQYSLVVGEKLGIVPPDATDKGNYDDLIPEFWITLMPDLIRIEFRKRNLDGIIIESMRGTETELTFLDKDYMSPFDDKRKNLVAGVPELRTYRVRFLKGDEAVGQYSLVAQVSCLI